MKPQRTTEERAVTRDEAREMLGMVEPSYQRRLNNDTAKRYARDMDAGEWKPGVAVIAFDTKGRLINGQHVLKALLLSNLKSLAVIVAMGRHPDEFAGFDKNRKRSARDDLKVAGYSKASELAAVAMVLWQYYKGFFDGRGWMAARGGAKFASPAEQVAIVEKHPGIHQHLWKSPFRGKGIAVGALRAASYLIHQEDEARAKKFMESFIEGINIPSTRHPIAVLRSSIQRMGVDERWRNGETLARILKAWKAYIGELPDASLRKGDQFPVPAIEAPSPQRVSAAGRVQ